MIRYIDLTADYYTDPEPNSEPVWAYLSTVTDTFLADFDGRHVCCCPEDVTEVERANGLQLGTLWMPQKEHANEL